MNFDWKIAVPWVLSLATVAIGVWQYADKQAQANREPFLKKQLELVFEASETVARLANVTDPKIVARVADTLLGALLGTAGPGRRSQRRKVHGQGRHDRTGAAAVKTRPAAAAECHCRRRRYSCRTRRAT